MPEKTQHASWGTIHSDFTVGVFTERLFDACSTAISPSRPNFISLYTTDDDAFFQDVVGVTEADSYATEGTCSLLDPGWRARLPFELAAP